MDFINLHEKLPRNSSGLSGEYFVAAELYRRGFSVGMTIGNAKAIDILPEENGIAHFDYHLDHHF